MDLKRVGVRFDRVRVDLNENFDKIEGKYKGLQKRFDNAVEEVADKAFDKVVDRAKIDWLPPVDTFDDLATTYPDATEGQTVMTRDTGKIYRMTDGVWMEIQDIDPTAINEVDSRLRSELAQTERNIGRKEYLKPAGDSVTEKVQNEFNDRGYNIAWNALLVSEDGDWAPAINAAVESVRRTTRKIFIPSGVFDIYSTVNIPNFVSVEGNGEKSILKAQADITMMTLHGTVDMEEGGNVKGQLCNFSLDGNNIATQGLYCGIIAYKDLTQVNIRDVRGVGLYLHDSQNSRFNSIELRHNDINLLMKDGPGNNVFTRVQFTGAKIRDLKMEGLESGSPVKQFRVPTANQFIKCIFEPLTGFRNDISVLIDQGDCNLFTNCQFVNGTVAKVELNAKASRNKFDHCYFYGKLSATPTGIINRAFATVVEDCSFENLGTDDVIQTHNTTYIIRPIFSLDSYVVRNYSGNTARNIRLDIGGIRAGSIRPNSYGSQLLFYDTNIGKLLFNPGNGWTLLDGSDPDRVFPAQERTRYSSPVRLKLPLTKGETGFIRVVCDGDFTSPSEKVYAVFYWGQGSGDQYYISEVRANEQSAATITSRATINGSSGEVSLTVLGNGGGKAISYKSSPQPL